MKKTVQLIGILTAITLTGCATTGDGAKWTCTAKNLVTAQYNGAGLAYVHLNPYSSGGMYDVKLNEARTEATGTTANGTPFKCVKAM